MKKKTAKNVSKMLDKKAIFGEMKLKTRIVPLKTGTVLISELPADKYLEMLETCSTVDKVNKDAEGNPKVEIDMKKFNPALVAYCVVDENGDRIFDDSDIELMAKSSTSVFNKMATAA